MTTAAKRIILVGAGGHARACLDVIECEGCFEVAGFIGTPEQAGTTMLGYQVLGTDADIARLRAVAANALVTVGQIKTPDPRMRLYDQLVAGGWRLPTIISPKAHVSRHATVGEGSIVMHGAIVNAAARVGRNCIINSQALVEHDCDIADHCHVATNAALNSGVRVGEGTFIGSGSSVRQGAVIGRHCVVGMGQRILADCPDGSQVPPRRVA